MQIQNPLEKQDFINRILLSKFKTIHFGYRQLMSSAPSWFANPGSLGYVFKFRGVYHYVYKSKSTKWKDVWR